MCGAHQLAFRRRHLGRSLNNSALRSGGQCDVGGLVGAFENV